MTLSAGANITGLNHTLQQLIAQLSLYKLGNPMQGKYPKQRVLIVYTKLSLSLLCFQFYLLFLPEFPIIFTHYSYFIPMPSPIIRYIL